MANGADRLEPTQLRHYYDSLHGLKEQEQNALAELHAEDPERLIARFAHSVQTVAAYPTITEPFHGERSEALLEVAGEPITSTTTFVAANDAVGDERARAEVADVTDAVAMTAVIDRAEEWGGVEVFVANAGVIAGGRPAWELPQEEEDAVVDVCLRGVMVAARVGIPALLRRPDPRAGRFVATASAASLRGLPGLAAYCAAKAGVSGFVRALAADLRGTGITAIAVAPGSTDTPILAESARLYALEGAPAFAAQQPIERLIDPAEIAATIAFLCGPAGAVITGTTVSVDGGLAI
jgi:SDR family mycofactocin-dependent oxidoreductase